jgi:glycosyltransferase involved in cell wall biosynthesis
MRISIDASVLEHPLTGVAKSTICLYRACVALDPAIKLNWVHRRTFGASIPDVGADVRWMSWVPARIWRQMAFPAFTATSKDRVFHFPWNGDVPALIPRHKTVITLHDLIPMEIPGYFGSEKAELHFRLRVARDIHRSRLIVTPSEYSRRKIVSEFRPQNEPEVIHWASSLPAAEATSLGLMDDDYFVYVGGYDARKSLIPLMKVFVELQRSRRINSRLVLVGTPNYFSSEFRALVEAGTASKAVEEKGYLPDEALAKLISRARGLVYPSKYEGFGLPPLEAMSLGCPVIVPHCSSLPEVCGSAAIYADPDDQLELAAAILALDKDAQLRAKKRIEGQQQAKKFSWRASAEKFLCALRRD